jgi:hypothetical protein
MINSQKAVVTKTSLIRERQIRYKKLPHTKSHIKWIIFLVSIFLIFLMGCQSYARHKAMEQAEIKHQEKINRLKSLPSCGSAEWFNQCDPNFLPKYRSIAVHIKPLRIKYVNSNTETILYIDDVTRSVKQLLEEKGYKVFLGKNLNETDYTENEQVCSAATQWDNGKLLEVKHNFPLFLKLSQENNNWNGYDAVLFLEYDTRLIYGHEQEGFRVRFQLYDLLTRRIVLWTDDVGITEYKTKKHGSSYTKTIGNKSYIATPYWFEGDDKVVLGKALKRAFKYLPSWNKDELVPQNFSKEEKVNCGFTFVLIWR